MDGTSADEGASGRPSGDTQGDGDGSGDRGVQTGSDGGDQGDESSTGRGSSGPWCVDADGDGFGDPGRCGPEPADGTVDNADDCDDDDVHTYPGAAHQEEDPGECRTDTDGDGWGDAQPSPGATPGADCWPQSAALHPGSVRPGSVDRGPFEDVAAVLDAQTATLSVVAPLSTPVFGWSVNGATLRDTGQVYVAEAQTETIRVLDYGPVCSGMVDEGLSTPLPMNPGVMSICGLSFDDEDRMWAVDADLNSLLELDPETADIVQELPLVAEGVALDLADCGLAWDCHQGRLLLAHSSTGQLFTVDRQTGEASLLATYDPDLGTAGVVYEPVEGVALVSSGLQLNRVRVDGLEATEVGTFNYDGAVSTDIANLGPILLCGR